MDRNDASSAAGASPPLPDGWLGALPALWDEVAGERSADPFAPARKLLDALYGGYLRMLAAGRPGDEPAALQGLLQGGGTAADLLVGLLRALSGPSTLGQWLRDAPAGAIGDALKPLALNLEHAYGGVADAFGLAPLRELDRAWRETVSAALVHRRAQADYLAVVAGALGKGAEALTARLAEMAQRGESVDTLLALLRLYAHTVDQAMHAAMQSPPALEASAGLLRAAARLRQQQQRVVAVASEALNMPTRAEVDNAYREIQELKRELRRLRKAVVPVAPAAGGDAPGTRPGVKRAPKEGSAA